jgi:hypothetical protein
MRAVIQAAIGKALLVLDEPICGAIGDDGCAVHDPGRRLGRPSAPPKIHGTTP